MEEYTPEWVALPGNSEHSLDLVLSDGTWGANVRYDGCINMWEYGSINENAPNMTLDELEKDAESWHDSEENPIQTLHIHVEGIDALVAELLALKKKAAAIYLTRDIGDWAKEEHWRENGADIRAAHRDTEGMT